KGYYIAALTFGNVHGVYKPGHVKLRPSVLKEIQDVVGAKYGKEKPFDLVFHGGSGSSVEEIHEAISYGVVKMNIDTDTQYAFTRPIVDHIMKNYDGVLKVDGDVGNKKAYDPRSYGKAAEAGMAARVVEAAQQIKPACARMKYRARGTPRHGHPGPRLRGAPPVSALPGTPWQDGGMELKQNLLGGPPPTELPDLPEAREALAAGTD